MPLFHSVQKNVTVSYVHVPQPGSSSERRDSGIILVSVGDHFTILQMKFIPSVGTS